MNLYPPSSFSSAIRLVETSLVEISRAACHQQVSFQHQQDPFYTSLVDYRHGVHGANPQGPLESCGEGRPLKLALGTQLRVHRSPWCPRPVAADHRTPSFQVSPSSNCFLLPIGRPAEDSPLLIANQELGLVPSYSQSCHSRACLAGLATQSNTGIQFSAQGKILGPLLTSGA